MKCSSRMVWEQVTGTPIEESFERGAKYGYFLQAITDIHLGADMEAELEPGGNVASIYIFSLIALFLIIIASQTSFNKGGRFTLSLSGDYVYDSAHSG